MFEGDTNLVVVAGLNLHAVVLKLTEGEEVLHHHLCQLF